MLWWLGIVLVVSLSGCVTDKGELDMQGPLEVVPAMFTVGGHMVKYTACQIDTALGDVKSCEEEADETEP